AHARRRRATGERSLIEAPARRGRATAPHVAAPLAAAPREARPVGQHARGASALRARGLKVGSLPSSCRTPVPHSGERPSALATVLLSWWTLAVEGGAGSGERCPAVSTELVPGRVRVLATRTLHHWLECGKASRARRCRQPYPGRQAEVRLGGCRLPLDAYPALLDDPQLPSGGSVHHRQRVLRCRGRLS